MSAGVIDIARWSLVAGWIAMLAGVASGMGIGLGFHREGWLGGYGSFRRRLLRLGHIACFGLGFLNVLFALSIRVVPLPASFAAVAAAGFALGAITMPLTCFLAAWQAPFRHLFPVPVVCMLAGVVSVLAGWGSS